MSEATANSISNGCGKVLVNYSSRPDYYVRPNGEIIPATGYRYLPEGSSKAIEAANTLTIPQQIGNSYKDYTYISFNKYDIANPGALQVPHDASVRASFDTKQILDDINIPKSNWNKGNTLEPITKSYYDYGLGGATQAITKSKIKLDEVIQLPKDK